MQAVQARIPGDAGGVPLSFAVNRLLSLLPLLVLAACDGSVSGTPDGNAAPSTELSVRAVSLVGQIPEADRLASTVDVSWVRHRPGRVCDRLRGPLLRRGRHTTR